MKYSVSRINDSLWQEVADNSPASTFFHTPVWTKILCQTFPRWENATFRLDYEDGNRAVFPLMRRSIVGKLPYYWHDSTVPGVYGGPIFQYPASIEHYKTINRELAQYDNILIGSNPYFDWHPEGSFMKYDTFIQVLRLSPVFKDIWKNYSDGRKSNLRHAKKRGVEVKEVNFLENYQAYYDIYRIQLKRWGRSASNYYPLKLFRNLADETNTNTGIKLWTAWIDNKMISGVVAFYQNKHLVLWHGATLGDYFRYRPVDLLYSTVIENACIAGYEIFDFLNSAGHVNLVEFKDRFGAIRLPFSYYRRRNIGGLLFCARRHLRTFLGLCPED